MIEIFPIKSQAEQERLVLRLGIDFDKSSRAYQASRDGKPIAICIFKIIALGEKEARGEITHVSSYGETLSEDVFFLLCRAVINFMLSCGVKNIDFPSHKFSEKLLLHHRQKI